MKKKEIMALLFKGSKRDLNNDLLSQIDKIWENKSHILHVGFRNSSDGNGQKLTFGFTDESNVELAEVDTLNFPLDDILQVRFTRTENIVKAPNNKVVVAKYKNMYRDELQEVINMLTEALGQEPSEVANLFKKGGNVKLTDLLSAE